MKKIRVTQIKRVIYDTSVQLKNGSIISLYDANVKSLFTRQAWNLIIMLCKDN